MKPLLHLLQSHDVICCDPLRWKSQMDLVAAMEERADMQDPNEPDTDYWGDPIEKLRIENGIAIVPVKGILCAGLPSIARRFGYVDPDDVDEDLEMARADDSVTSVWLDMNCPGGTLGGISELAAKIRGMDKPTCAYGSMICSAAYWIASGCNRIMTTALGDVGSIGVYTAFIDRSGWLAQLGMSVKLFASGKYKGAGVTGSLTKDQSALIQDRVNAIAANFKSWVNSCRPGMSENDMQGQSFLGADAAQRKLTDGTCASLSEAIADYTAS